VITEARQQTAEELEREVAALYTGQAAALLRYARARADSDDTAREGLQEAFLRYFIERSYGREILNPRAWLFEVLRNYLSDRASTLSSQREVVDERLDAVPDLRQDPESRFGGIEAAGQIAASLSGRELQCLRLRTEGLSYLEIGRAMRVRTGTVGAILARASEKLRQFAESDPSGQSALAAGVFYLIEERAGWNQG
jgi:RNA polymerase sigma factor (sigma-70 family)